MQEPQLQYVTFELTTRCNFRCKMCLAHQKRDTLEGGFFRPDMPYDRFTDLVDQAVAINPNMLINPQKAGESFLHPRIFDAIEYVKNKGAKLIITTNGTMNNPDVNKWLIDMQVEDFIVSIDGATKETFENIRGHRFRSPDGRGPFQTVFENTVDLYEQRKKSGVDLPRLHISFCLQEDNFHEMDAVINFWAPRADTMNLFNKIYDFKYERKFYISPPAIRPPCSKLWERLYVMSDGRVHCCSVDQNCLNPMGNAFVTPLKDIFWGEKYTKMRQDHLMGRFDLYESCANCEHYNPRNMIYSVKEVSEENKDFYIQKDVYEGFITIYKRPFENESPTKVPDMQFTECDGVQDETVAGDLQRLNDGNLTDRLIRRIRRMIRH